LIENGRKVRQLKIKKWGLKKGQNTEGGIFFRKSRTFAKFYILITYSSNGLKLKAKNDFFFLQNTRFAHDTEGV
jgi:hypothetical protein